MSESLRLAIRSVLIAELTVDRKEPERNDRETPGFWIPGDGASACNILDIIVDDIMIIIEKNNSSVDFQSLLHRYMHHVGYMEGSTFLPGPDGGSGSDMEFSADEAKILHMMDGIKP